MSDNVMMMALETLKQWNPNHSQMEIVRDVIIQAAQGGVKQPELFTKEQSDLFWDIANPGLLQELRAHPDFRDCLNLLLNVVHEVRTKGQPLPRTLAID